MATCDRHVLCNQFAYFLLLAGFRVVAAMLMGLIVSAMYYQIGVANGTNYYGEDGVGKQEGTRRFNPSRRSLGAGLYLNTCLFLTFANMSEMSPTFALKRIAHRQARGSEPEGRPLPLLRV